MNSTQIAGLAYESEDFSSNWYYRFAQHPYYPPYGLNSGVMLMNLTKMRQFDWIKRTEEIYQNFRNKIVWGDQDIINIIFSENQDRIHLFGCNWNYRPDHCVYGLTCRRAVTEGIKILHGNRDSFVGSKQPAFKFIFEPLRDKTHHQM
ncbi:glycosyltransferase-like protein [Sarcoptes scabiei]|uniref:UDP-D-xylose:beta-D-glucoside alpha-1,3-D-xylosyltransferase n=1 Tax=Sarcoptes scabiei TaxID=52283 RepID=A0A132A4N8_SARSC|nr:glycosyltransferase-like protein [Sarcoptes scabiei]